MNINQIMKQAQAMQQKVLEMQEKIAQTDYEGSAGGGMVKITITGKHDVKQVKIDPSIVDKDDIEMLEDLVMAAFNDAKKKADEATESTMGNLMGGMGLPSGFKLPF